MGYSFDMHGKVFVLLCQTKKMYLKWYRNNDQLLKPKHRFWNLNADSEVKVNVNKVKTLICMDRSCPKTCVCQTLKVSHKWYRSCDNFSKPKRKFRNQNAKSEVNFKVTGVKILAWKGLVLRHVCAKYKWCTSICIGAMINFRNLNKDFET